MVIVKRPLVHSDVFGLKNEGLSLIQSGSIAGKTLQGTNMSSLTGLMFQLSSLSLIAQEMFQSIMSSSEQTFNRISSLTSRLQNVNNQLQDIEHYMLTNNHNLLFNSLGYQFTEKGMSVLTKLDQQNISKANNPSALEWQYESNCDADPKFDSDLDALVLEEERNKKKKRTCKQLYSYPQFFFEYWAKEELQRQREERKALREKRKQMTTHSEVKKKEVAAIQLHYKRYDKHGNKLDEPAFTPRTPRDSDNTSSGPLTPSPRTVDHTPSTPLQRGESFNKPKPPPGPPPQSPPRSDSIRSPSVPELPLQSVTVGPPPPPPPSMQLTSAPPLSPNPPLNSPPTTGSLADMMANVSLKKATEQAPKAPDSRGNLLDQIRMGKKLAPASERSIAEKKEEKKEMDVAAILNNKFASVLNDESDEEDDSQFSDDDWD